MNFYVKMVIKVLEKTISAKESEVLKKLKEVIDIDTKDRKELEELIYNL